MSNSEPSTPNILIQTKLARPRLSRDFLPRPHLVQRLENGRHRKLTLISAPAGYGKSTMASVWLEVCDCRSAWLSLDKHDNDFRIFLNYFIAAVHTSFPDCCLETQMLLNGPQLPSLEYLATTLINESVVLPEPLIIALDDCHHIQNKDIHRLLDNLIQYQSEKLHLVIITRQDPLLGIAALRAKGQLTEIRLNDLRFDREEVQRYWQTTCNETPLPDLLDGLTNQTEGWAAGLYLASLAFQGRGDDAGFLKTYGGTHQYVMGYLTDEVLARQPETVQSFLLRTSILDRFCAPLCDALLESADTKGVMAESGASQDILKQLAETNLFLIPLDHEGMWFRYHHLFQNLLFHKLRTGTSSEQLASLHAAAGVWLGENGHVEAALDHLLAVNETSEAVALVEQQRYALSNNTQWQQLEHYLHRFSPAVIEQYPELLMLKAWLLYHQWQWPEIPVILQRLEQLLPQSALSQEEINHFQGEISALLSLMAYLRADPQEAIAHAERSIQTTRRELWIVRVLARNTLGAALQMTGDLSGAYAAVYSGFEKEKVRSNAFKATLLIAACTLYWVAADLQGLALAAEQSFALSQNAKSPEMRGFASYHQGTVAYQKHDLNFAEQHFSAVVRQPYLNYGDVYAYSACGLALSYQAQGRPEEARAVAESAIAFVLQTGNTTLLPVAQALQAELALRQGQITTASQWASQFTTPPPMEQMFRFYAPHFTLLKVWLGQNTSSSRQRAGGLLGQLKAFLERTHNTRFLMETLAFQALLDDGEGRRGDAVTALGKAVELAEPGGFIRLFVDLGPQMARLLAKLPLENAETQRYVSQILAAFSPVAPKATDAHGSAIAKQPLLEPLTDREMDVLILLAQRQSDKEIARQLVISYHTVRTHIKNIFAKLEVRTRRQATVRAGELGLVRPEKTP
ncbi:MAG: LuxR C-terminal-related transcriptional regulator [Chloroflexota bacterium]|nr:LuxR C-terminal-related transcriptional regulator [Chloroflexota bacterium]